ncbi:hypothetical protein EFM1CSP_18895 [Enterococcus faecium]|nr:hypothetical protein EFM1CSP_18895 [Enterococcus faecium]
MDFRASTIVTYLLFQKGYVSMQKDSRHFSFLSKKQPYHLQNKKRFLRWIERNPKLELEVSSTKRTKKSLLKKIQKEFSYLLLLQGL